MSRNNQKKQRHEQKRREKRSLLRRADQVSPYRRIGDGGSPARCYINDDWREEGLASIYALYRVPAGGHAMACFLIDRWCLGLKDAFGRLDVTVQAFEGYIEHFTNQGIHAVSVDIGTVRRLVAAAIRWSHEHDFRLPPRYERWVTLIGGVGDWHTADTSEFGFNGKLRYEGPLVDLEKRLGGTSLEAFMAREDVEVIGGLGESLIDDEDQEIMEEGAQVVQGQLLTAIRRWCFASGKVPHPRLEEAIEILLTSILEAPPAEDQPEKTDFAAADRNLALQLSLEADGAELRDALEQASAFMQQFGGVQELADAAGLPLEDDEASG